MKTVLFAAASLAFALATTPAIAQEAAPALTIVHPSDAHFQAVPNVAPCNTMMSLRGNLAKEASTFITKMTPGCVAPWHWHSATEEIIVLQGTAKMQMNSIKEMPMVLPTGAYSQLTRLHLHRFKCEKGPDCIMIVVADRAFDLHWVDKNRKEISFDEALKIEKAGPAW